ncbi:MAG TPA: GNAT family N-acetyltransferase [Actinomycetota bacterium]|nr:GNAT family N-acetyltransferase [Actinomycetota bacterium]
MDESEIPKNLEKDVVLRDGRTVHLRPARSEDRGVVEDYLIGLSDESRRLRFWSTSIDVTDLAARAVRPEYPDHLTLLAVTGRDPGHVVGGAQFIRENATRAELSVSVSDELQGSGLGSLLVGNLVDAAYEAGIGMLEAQVLPENHRMIDVFRKTGFPISIRAKPGAVSVEIATAPTEEAVAHFEEREAVAAASAVRTILEPETVAVIGASRDEASIGGRLLRNLLTHPFKGTVYPVNPSAPAVQGVKAYATIDDVPGPVDVAFIAVKAPLVAEVAESCGRKGVRGLVVISAGFAETGGEGPVRQRELVEICRRWGMRLVGPNCMGVVNTDPDVDLNGTFATIAPEAGSVGFLSQSGAVGIAVMSETGRRDIGLSSFVSVGNKADISGNDMLSYWEDDPRTNVVLLYLESFGNPRRFSHLARRIGKRKPIVAVKSGRTRAGQRAAGSHTGSLVGASDLTVDALFRENGVIRTDTLAEMFDVAMLLATQPSPRGNRVGIVTNAGGLGILCADTCEANGLVLPPLSRETVEELHTFLPSEASTDNPVDMIASATGQDFERAVLAVASDPDVDIVIVIYIPPLEQHVEDVARGIGQAIKKLESGTPVLTSFMSGGEVPVDPVSGRGWFPSFAFPEQAAIAAARAVEHGRWRDRAPGTVPRFTDVRSDEADGILASALSRGSGWLEPEEVDGLLACYGIPVAMSKLAITAEEAGRLAAELGVPVALKAVGPLHKSDVGGVRLGLSGKGAVTAAAKEMQERLGAFGEPLKGFSVQEMVEGVEMLVGVTHDDVFGPIVACGAGGTIAELLKDVAVRVAPVTDVAAREMVRSLKTFPLLDGYRGAPRADVPALEEIILRVSALASDHEAVREMDCNPVMVGETRAVVVDSRLRVAAS